MIKDEKHENAVFFCHVLRNIGFLGEERKLVRAK
jgi:hypothetical protein